MPDRRKHRGPHPNDLHWFSVEARPLLRRATADLAWLLSRGYPHAAALALVGNRYALVARQRIAVARCACSDEAAARRRRHRVASGALRGQPLWIDGYNVLTTLEAALAGGILLAACDGALRDMASMHGSYRKVQETLPALRHLGRHLASWGVGEAVWLLDRPVSNSGRLKQLMEDLAREQGWPWRIELTADPDGMLASSPEIVATADSAILDRCGRWFNLALETVRVEVPAARMVDLDCFDSKAPPPLAGNHLKPLEGP
ncbi:MAG TPA: DUF434 domain-containing protein [Geothrix sp.]|nr:DUF434 domain-containing protein [Geothrix sp.]